MAHKPWCTCRGCAKVRAARNQWYAQHLAAIDLFIWESDPQFHSLMVNMSQVMVDVTTDHVWLQHD